MSDLYKRTGVNSEHVTYLCQAWGESDLPEVKIVKTLAEARDSIIQFCWNPVSDAPNEARDAMYADFDQQMEDDDCYKTEFEIGGISVTPVVAEYPNWESSLFLPQQGGEQTPSVSNLEFLRYEEDACGCDYAYYRLKLSDCEIGDVVDPAVLSSVVAAAVLPQVGESSKFELTEEMRTALDAANKSGKAYTILPDGTLMTINRGEQPEDTSDLNCPHCHGSGHKDDVKVTSCSDSSEFGLQVGEAKPHDDIAAIRLRGICNMLGLANAVPEDNAELLEAQFSVFGMIRGAIERERKSTPMKDSLHLLTEETIKAIESKTGPLAAPAGLGEAKAVALEGWKTVPITPTERMICAGIEAYQGRCEDSYAAMLAAAPVAQAMPVVAEKIPETTREKALNTILWFYRRAEPIYGKLKFADEAIELLQEEKP